MPEVKYDLEAQTRWLGMRTSWLGECDGKKQKGRPRKLEKLR